MKTTDTNFWRFFENRIADLEREGRWGTATNYRKAERSFKSFSGNDGLTFDDISQDFIGSYNRHLLSNGLIRNSVSQYNRVLRAVYNRGVKAGLAADRCPFANVYTGSDKTLKRALPEKDLAKIARVARTGPLEFVGDLFVFSYFTCGMAFVDMAYLKKSDIHGNVLIYYRRKTGSRIQIRLTPAAVTILRKYSHVAPDSQYVFPILGNRTGMDAYRRFCSALTEYNRGLKKLSGKAGVSRNISSYVPRHSWATAARNNGAELCVISEALGHCSERTTRIYLADFDTRKIDAINRKLIKNIGMLGSC